MTSNNNRSALKWTALTKKRQSSTRGIPPGHESLNWVANTVVLIYGDRDAVLVDTFLSADHTRELADWILASGRNLTTIYVTHAHGEPMNLLGTELVRDLVSLIQRAEADSALQVLVFASADADYFISHVDVTQLGKNGEQAAKLTGEPSLGILFRRLSASRLVTIAQIEGACVVAAASSCWRAICVLPLESRRCSVSPSTRSACSPARAASSTWRVLWVARGHSRSC